MPKRLLLPGLHIAGKPLGDPTQPYVIAEASANHAHNYYKATELVYAAAKAGADAIKFQTFAAEDIAADVSIPVHLAPEAHRAMLERLGATTLRDLFRQGGLPYEWHYGLKELAEELGLAFLSTPFSVPAAQFLIEDLGVQAVKIASGDLTFTPLLQYVARFDLPILLSTGGATLVEIVHALIGPLARANDLGHVSLLHCVSAYPCPTEAANLRAIRTLCMAMRGRPIGYSDHTLSEALPAVAVSLGASIIEKHLRLEDSTGADVDHSLTPPQFARMVTGIREAAVALGSGVKEPHALEAHDRLWARRASSDWLRPTDEARQGAWE